MSSSRTQPPAKIDLTSPDLPRSAFPATNPEAAPTSPQLEKSAARAMSSTDSWKPSMGARKQSYHKEDHKHALQMSGISGSAGEKGFSEETH